MTWPEVISEALLVILLLGGGFLFVVMMNGWPGSRDD